MFRMEVLWILIYANEGGGSGGGGGGKDYHWNVKAEGGGGGRSDGWPKAEGTTDDEEGEALLPAGRK